MLNGVRVVDCTTEIAGPYCSKLLADAGADVVKVEPSEGDPLRHWGSGALFEYLNTSKRSVQGDPGDLLLAADVFVSNEPADTGVLWAGNPSLVVVTITPFGTEGPWADRPSTEFTLQAACGSIGQRGLPEDPPLAAGGRLGEWTTGTYAALGAIAALREARRCGRGELVDVAMLDCMAVAMVTYPSVFASFAGWPKTTGTGRTIEVPSIEPSRDGYFVVTTNSAQQFHDFLLMIERPDLVADPDLAQVAKRFRRREEFLSAVHHFTTQRSTEEILEAAALFRIPAGPLLNGSTVTAFEQFAARTSSYRTLRVGSSNRECRIASRECRRDRSALPRGSVNMAARSNGPTGRAPPPGSAAARTQKGRPQPTAGASPWPTFVSSTAPPGGPVRRPPPPWLVWEQTSSRLNR